MKVVVERYHGLGNDYLVFDPNHNELKLDEANVKMLCDRNEGLGADGVSGRPDSERRRYARKSMESGRK